MKDFPRIALFPYISLYPARSHHLFSIHRTQAVFHRLIPPRLSFRVLTSALGLRSGFSSLLCKAAAAKFSQSAAALSYPPCITLPIYCGLLSQILPGIGYPKRATQVLIDTGFAFSSFAIAEASSRIAEKRPHLLGRRGRLTLPRLLDLESNRSAVPG